MLVVVPLGILLAPVPKIFIEIFKGCNGRNGNESVSAAVTHLVFYITLFIAGGRIAEIRLEPVMKHETVETVGKDTLGPFQHLCYSGSHVVKAEPDGNTADSLKDPLHAFQQAFLVL